MKNFNKYFWLNDYRKWFIIHISDVVAYMRDDKIRRKIKIKLKKMLNPLLNDDNMVNIIIAHSLGSVIAFDVLKEYQEHGLQADYFFSLGSPLAIFVNDFEHKNTFYEPVKLKKLWLNIIGNTDVIAYTLNDIDEKWNNEIVQDKIILFGNILKRFLPLSHSEYLKSKKIAKIIATNINKYEKEIL